MTRQIDVIEASDIFWSDLRVLRKESWYPEIRRSIAKFVTDMANGNTVKERGFSNSRLKGVMHVSLPKDMRLFHVYPENTTLRLCIVANHKVYGFKGKNKARENATADRIWRAAESDHARSPMWDIIKWRRPSDLINNPELHEMSVEGLNTLSEELNLEVVELSRLKRLMRKTEVDSIPSDVLDAWFEDLVTAQEYVFETIESHLKERRQSLRVNDFEGWMEP